LANSGDIFGFQNLGCRAGAQNWDPSSSRSGNWEDGILRPAQAKNQQVAISTNKLAWWPIPVIPATQLAWAKVRPYLKNN
jgi:hypothetical protein